MDKAVKKPSGKKLAVDQKALDAFIAEADPVILSDEDKPPTPSFPEKPPSPEKPPTPTFSEPEPGELAEEIKAPKKRATITKEPSPIKRQKTEETKTASKKTEETKTVSKKRNLTPSFTSKGKLVEFKRHGFNKIFDRNPFFEEIYEIAPFLRCSAPINDVEYLETVYNFGVRHPGFERYTIPEATVGDWHITSWLETARLLAGEDFESADPYAPIFAVSINKTPSYSHTGSGWVCISKARPVEANFKRDVAQLLLNTHTIIKMTGFLSTQRPVRIPDASGLIGASLIIRFTDRNPEMDEWARKILLPSKLRKIDRDAWESVPAPWRCCMVMGWTATEAPLAIKFGASQRVGVVASGISATKYESKDYDAMLLDAHASALHSALELALSGVTCLKTGNKLQVFAPSKFEDIEEPTTAEQIANWATATHRLTQVGGDFCVEVALTHAFFGERVPPTPIKLVYGKNITMTIQAHGLNCKIYPIGKLKGKDQDSLATRISKTGRDAKIPFNRILLESKCVTRAVSASEIDFHCNFAEVQGDRVIIWNTWNLTNSEPMGPPTYQYRLEELYKGAEPDLWRPLKVYFIFDKTIQGKTTTLPPAAL